MHGLMSYRRFGRARGTDARSLRSDRAWLELGSDRAEHAFGRFVAAFFELLSDVSCFLRKSFRKK
ncbi:unnamed protein product [Brassica oleracea]